MKLHLKFNVEHRKRPQVSFDSTRANYLLNTNSSRPGTGLSLGNLHSHPKTVELGGGLERPIPKKSRPRGDGHGMTSLQLPSSTCRSRRKAAWCSTRSTTSLREHPPQVHLAQGPVPTPRSGRIRPSKKPSGYARGSAPPGRPHGKKLPGEDRPKAKLRS